MRSGQLERRQAIAFIGACLGSGIWGARAFAAVDGNADWGEVRALVRPKILPSYFVDAFPGLVHRPLSPKLVISYSIDRGQSDEYVREASFASWRVAPDTLHAHALSNLEAMTQDLALPIGADSALTISKGDGYDGARLLLPGLRARMLAVIGPRMMAAAPARDLLMVWSLSDAKRHDLVAQVGREWRARPHALSAEIFMVTAGGLDVADPQALRQ